MASPEEAKFLAHFRIARRNGDGWMVRCPGPNHEHGDRNASLSIHHRNGKWLLRCFAECTAESIAEAAGLGMTDLFDDPAPMKQPRNPVRGKVIERWPHTTADGRTRTFLRYENGDRTWDGDTEVKTADLAYMRWFKADTSVHFFTEGEPDADALGATGLSVVGRPSHHRPSAQSLRRFTPTDHIVIIPDADKPGWSKAHAWRDAFEKLGFHRVDVADINKLHPSGEAPHKWDVEDWLTQVQPENPASVLLASFVGAGEPVESEDPDALPHGWRLASDDAAIEPATPLCHGLVFRGKLGMLHGPAKAGKTTLLANALARFCAAKPFAGEPTTGGMVAVVTEDEDTWKHVFQAVNGNVDRLIFIDCWPVGERIPEEVEVIVIDTFNYVATRAGINPNQATDTDTILRPLQELAQQHGIAVVVTDHEPHAEGGVGTRGRPRNSTAKGATCDYLLGLVHDGGHARVSPSAPPRAGISVPKTAVFDKAGELVAGEGRKRTPDEHAWVLEHVTEEPATVTAIIERSGHSQGKKPTGKQARKFRGALISLQEFGLVKASKKKPDEDASRFNPWLYQLPVRPVRPSSVHEEKTDTVRPSVPHPPHVRGGGVGGTDTDRTDTADDQIKGTDGPPAEFALAADDPFAVACARCGHEYRYPDDGFGPVCPECASGRIAPRNAEPAPTHATE